MAEKKNDDDLDTPKRSKKKFIIFAALALLILSVPIYLGTAWVLSKQETYLFPFEAPGPTPEEIAAKKAEEEKSQKLLQREIYVKCSEKFSFNIKSERRVHTGQVDVVLVVQGEENEALAKKHLTLIDSVIFDKLSAQTYEGLLLPSGRQRLKRELLDATRAKMSEIAKAPVVDQILFTSFVLQ